MADKSFKTESDIKDYLGIDDFKNISKNKRKLAKFISAFPNMSQELALKCIEQFGNFKDYANNMLDVFADFCTKILADDGNDAIGAYRDIINSLKIQAEKDYISVELQMTLNQQMFDAGKQIIMIDRERRELKKNAIKNIYNIAGIGIAGAVFVLTAGKFGNFPFLKK